MTGADWGTVPAWISAIATTVGFGWALVLFQISRWQAVRSPARSVYCHLDRGKGRIVVENTGKAPIVGLAVFIAHGPEEVADDEPLRWLAAEARREVEVPNTLLARADEIHIEFDDCLGRRWRRTSAFKTKRLR